MANSKERAFGYIRVSTSMQVEGGYSLDDQANKIREKAKKEGYELVDIFRDEGKSGKNISGRPQFQEMLRRIQGGEKIDYVLVTRLSRFGRNASDVLKYLKKLQSYGANLICIDDKLDSSTKMGDAMLKLSSIFAEMERENIREQTRAGRYEKARQGKWNGGQAPYGYRIGRDGYGASTGVLVVDEDEAKVIRDIFDWYANENMGIAGISTKLNTNEVRKVPRGNGNQSYFTPESVKKILENPVYNGKIAYGRRKMTLVEGSDNEYRPKAQSDYKVYEGLHDAIVDDETFERVQRRRERESVAFPRKRDGHVSVLSGLLKCPVCGHGLISQHTAGKIKKDGTRGQDTYAYRCKYPRKSHGAICTYTTQLPQHVLLAEVDELFQDIWRQEHFFGKALNEQLDAEMDEDKLQAEVDRLKKLVASKETRIEKLAETQDSLDTEDRTFDRKFKDLQDRMDTLYEERETLVDELNDALAKLDARNSVRATTDTFISDVLTVLQGGSMLSDEEKVVLYNQVFEHFEIDPDANYRKGDRVISKAYVRIPVSTARKLQGWTVDDSRVKEDTVESIVLLEKQKSKAKDYVKVGLDTKDYEKIKENKK